MLEQQMIYEIKELGSSGIGLSFGRLSVGVITGIGFIGAGTITISKSKIVGLTTAASLWCIGCLGLLNGMGYSLLALIVAIVIVIALLVLRIDDMKKLNRVIDIEFINHQGVEQTIEDIFKEKNVKIIDYSIVFRKESDEKVCSVSYLVEFKNKDEVKEVMFKLAEIDDVTIVQIENAV